MEFPIIPWKVFLDAPPASATSTLEPWLRHWWFTNEGVIMESWRGKKWLAESTTAANHEAVQA
jgi:hypothetical protein